MVMVESNEFIVNDEQKSESRTTSFSQIRQRSVSSYVMGSTNTQQVQQAVHVPATHKLPPASPPTKKSIGVQHSPQYPLQQQQQQQPAQAHQATSTIVCMLVATADKPKHMLNKNDLIRCARLAVRQAATTNAVNASPARRSHSLSAHTPTSKKCSLPDLTFLNEYSGRKVDHSEVTRPATGGLSTGVSAPAPELLKRKTLKSIKRYRQTKQNTEPCGVLAQQPPLPPHHCATLQQQYSTVNSQLHSNLNYVNTMITTSPELIKKQMVN